MNARLSALIAILILVACGQEESTDVQSLPHPTDTPTPSPTLISPTPVPTPETTTVQRIQWGAEPQQFGDLYLPAGVGPWPVVVMIHGGCWYSGYTLQLQHPLSQALADRDFAVWNIEYRSLGNGGDWPVMFEDVAAAADFLPRLAITASVDIDRVVAMGHSAGGHLALWLASRQQIPTASALYLPSPQLIRGVITLGGIADLTASTCGSAPMGIINGGGLSSEQLAFRLRESSPLQMLPSGTPSVLISGAQDTIVPADISAGYAEAATALGDESEHLVLDGADHFYLIDPDRLDLNLIEDALTRMLQP